METPCRRKNGGGFEEKTIAILQSTGFSTHDERLLFLEAFRSVLSSPSPLPLRLGGRNLPKRRQLGKMFDAIFQILRDNNSMELAMASYQLLVDIDKRYPRVHLKSRDNPKSSSTGVDKLVVVKESRSLRGYHSLLAQIIPILKERELQKVFFTRTLMPHMLFTGLEDYKARGTQVGPYFTVTHYTEFAENKDLVLIRET